MAARASLIASRFVGQEDSLETAWNPMREESRWVGKPWRRVELLTRRFFYRGEQTEVNRDLTIHAGCNRLGFAFTLILSRAPVFDYSDERQ